MINVILKVFYKCNFRSVIYFFGFALQAISAYSDRGTTPNIKEIFIGRCLNFQQFPNGRLFDPKIIDCVNLWEVFAKAWVYKDPSSVQQNDYETYFQLADDTNIPEDKIYFFSATHELAHELSNQGRRYVTLEDTRIGYIANELNWCGSTDTTNNCDGINYETCPTSSDLPQEAAEAFWGGASSNFAKKAGVEARVILSGTNPDTPAYRNTSFFAKFEMQNMSPNTKLHVILANEPDKQVFESCDTGSLLQLKEDAESLGLKFTCEENPPEILHLMCIDYPSLEACKFHGKDRKRSSALKP